MLGYAFEPQPYKRGCHRPRLSSRWGLNPCNHSERKKLPRSFKIQIINSKSAQVYMPQGAQGFVFHRKLHLRRRQALQAIQASHRCCAACAKRSCPIGPVIEQTAGCIRAADCPGFRSMCRPCRRSRYCATSVFFAHRVNQPVSGQRLLRRKPAQPPAAYRTCSRTGQTSSVAGTSAAAILQASLCAVRPRPFPSRAAASQRQTPGLRGSKRCAGECNCREPTTLITALVSDMSPLQRALLGIAPLSEALRKG